MAPKRQRTASTTKLPANKKLKSTVPNPLDSILAPLITAGKLRINNQNQDNIQNPGEIYNDNDKIKKHNVYKKFFDSVLWPSLKPTENDLARFIPHQLATINTNQHPISEDKFNNGFDYLTLAKTPHRGANNSRMDFYDMEAGPSREEQAIRMSPYDAPGNPQITLTHEGTHALDDAYMRTYQKEAIDALAKMEPQDATEWKTWFDKGDWYNQAQNILDIENFKTYYPYAGINAQPNIKKSFSNLTNDYSDNEFNTQKNEEVNNFQSAQKAFEWLAKNRPDQAPNSKHFYASLGEFPAFAVQNISNPWNISNEKQKANYWQNNNDGRKFLKRITKGVYRNFRELDPEFSTKYPEANKSFLDRITQLRNYDKPRGQTDDGYKEYLYQTKFPQSNPYGQVNPAAYNQNTNPITQQLAPPIQQQNMPSPGVPNPVNNVYQYYDARNNTTTGAPPNGYPQILSPEI
jgi:hypothetical protein